MRTQWEQQNNVSTTMLAVSSGEIKKDGKLVNDGKSFSSLSGDVS